VRGGVGPSAEQPGLVVSVQQGSGEPGWASGLAPATGACSLLVTPTQRTGDYYYGGMGDVCCVAAHGQV
jgi:hypothetical protein